MPNDSDEQHRRLNKAYNDIQNGPRVTMGKPGESARAVAERAELYDLRDRVYEYEQLLTRLKEEPKLCAVVVEVEQDRGIDDERDVTERTMTLAMGPGQTAVVRAIKDARGEVKVGDRVLVNRNTLQASEIIRDAVPAGPIVTVERVSEDRTMIEATFLAMLRSFACPPSMRQDIKKNDRLVLDAGASYVIGRVDPLPPPAAYVWTQLVGISWDDIGGQEEAKAQMREAIETPLLYPEMFKAYGKRGIKGVLLHGSPGCGKTLIAKAAATSIAKAHGSTLTSAGFVYVKGPELINPYIGKSEEAIRNLFKTARAHKAEHGYPSVIFLDECDALLGIRDRGLNVSVNATTVPQFLAEMDGLEDSAAIFVLATNRPDSLDPAVLREGRVDRKVRVDRPTREDGARIFEIHLAGRPVSARLGDGMLAGMIDVIGDEAHEIRYTKRCIAAHGVAELWSDERVLAEVRDPESDPHLGVMAKVRLRDAVSGAMIAEIVERASSHAMMRDIEAKADKATGISVDDITWAIDRLADSMRDMMTPT